MNVRFGFISHEMYYLFIRTVVETGSSVKRPRLGVFLLRSAFLLPALLSLLILTTFATAEWSATATEGLPLCTAENEQHFPVLVPDDQGGAIVAWSDARHANRDIFAQRVSAEGDMYWAANGIPICDLPSSQSWPLIVSDTQGGAILIWGDTRRGNQDSYAQRIDANGEKLWAPEGVPVCTHPTLQDDLNATADGKGGVIVVWEDWRNGNQDIYAQRIDATGKPLWEADGVPVYKGDGDQYDPVLVADEQGGAIFAWWDISTPDWNIFAQRLSAAGEPLWDSTDTPENTPVPVCTAAGNQGAPFAVSDETGGVFFVWSDYRNDPNFYTSAQLYAQRINASGDAVWAQDGIPLCALRVNQQQPYCIPDGSGGLIVTWWDERDIFADVYAQRINEKGEAMWNAENTEIQNGGVPVCTGAGVQRVPQIVATNAVGTAIVYWLDYREDFGDATEDAIYAQRLDADGKPLWEFNGIPVCLAPKAQITPQAVPTADGAALVVWSDARGSDYDIYIQRIP